MLIRSMSDLGELVRRERRRGDLSQVDLAAKAGVSRKWLADFEKGKRSVEAGLILRTLAALGIALDATPAQASRSGSPASAPTIDLDEHLARLRDGS